LNLYENSRDVLSRLRQQNNSGIPLENVARTTDDGCFNASGSIHPSNHPISSTYHTDHEVTSSNSSCHEQQHLLGGNSSNYVSMTARQRLTADYEPMEFERAERDSSEETASGEYCDGTAVSDGPLSYPDFVCDRRHSEYRRSTSTPAEASGAYNYDTVDSMDIMSDRYVLRRIRNILRDYLMRF
jgi:hypothetical protein